ncbi:MAG TPA: hypothetical protein GX401_08520 [Clostridiales bacterium]|nr:hypothetical protein [Clostridiales bacterium]
MHIAVLILFFLAFGVGFALQGRYFVHMLQLHGYDTHVQGQWITKKFTHFIPKQILALLTIPLIAFVGDTGIILSGIIYIILGYVYKPREYRQPMQYKSATMKVILPVGIISCILYCIAICINENTMIMALILAVLYVVVPFIIMLVNSIVNKNKKRNISQSTVKEETT